LFTAYLYISGLKRFNMIKYLFIFILLVWGIACTGDQSAEEQTTQRTHSKQLDAFFEEYFNWKVESHPMLATNMGRKINYGKWNDPSEKFLKEEVSQLKQYYQWLQDSISTTALSPDEKLSYDLWVYEYEKSLTEYEFRHYRYFAQQMHGFQSSIPSFLITKHLVKEESDAEAYIARLNGLKDYISKYMDRMQAAGEAGVVPPKFVFDYVIDDCRNIISGYPFEESEDKNVMYADIESKINSLTVPEGRKQELLKQAEKALLDSVQIAYQSLIKLAQEQQASATTDDGIWKTPKGAENYEFLLAKYNTTELTPDEIHEIGLAEVDRIHGEIKGIMEQVDFSGSLSEFFEFMRTDMQFYYPNTDEGKAAYMDSATAIIDQMRQELPQLFLTLPKAPMEVRRVEAYRENSASKAFYNAPSLDGSRPGIYYANLANSMNMPKYEMEALAYHEGIPGHHMQIAIAQELEDMPEFRKFLSISAYTEGWGLYSELLPKEIGMYKSPYADYGRLAMELWRSCRLVVDTGIHFKKWTREESIDYYMNNTSGSERECIRMVERHIVIPGQATAYKLGMLKILELREKVQEALGPDYDIREFHDVILRTGEVPLFMLEAQVEAYLDRKKPAA